MEQKLRDAVRKLPEPQISFDSIQSCPTRQVCNPVWKRVVAVAACAILLIAIGSGTYVYTVEAKEYREAVRFFENYGLSTAGLTRDEIKAVYRDITTESFSYPKTSDVITNSILQNRVDGYEILQEEPTPEDVENLWNYMNIGNFVEGQEDGTHYNYGSEYKEDPNLGFEVHDKSYVEKYEEQTLVWRVEIPEFWISDYIIVSCGVIAYGQTETWSSLQKSYAWMVKISEKGEREWIRKLDHGFEDEYIGAILQNPDGSYGVISRGDLKYFCVSQYTASGEEISFHKTEVGNCGIWNAVCFQDGYLVQLGNYMTGEYAKIVKVDRDGTITDSFSYTQEDAYYYITDMIEFSGKIYLSAYSVPKLEDETQSAGGRYEIASVLNYLFDHNIWEISDEELTPMVRENYTALLLVCEPQEGTPQEFYSVKGSMGGALSHSDTGMLLWDVESITSTFYSPATSSFTIGGTSTIFRYTFEKGGMLVQREKTGETVPYRR